MQELLEFVYTKGEELYGRNFSTLSSHNLTHLAGSAVRYGSIEEISCWKYESAIGLLVDKGNNTGLNPLGQLIRRNDEIEKAGFYKPSTPCRVTPCQFSNMERDNYYIDQDHRHVVKLVGRGASPNTALADIYDIEDIFVLAGIPSRAVGKVEISLKHKGRIVTTRNLKKGFYLPCEDKHYFMLMVHEC